ncbi:hypothetical protein PILCRDRAFT_820679 [Piloderma croceum F 1598]|uniref:Uncharacterized protein n=1 Tax=Piloderma croceum (strain F 1598) TaxID=765440 RepID=A0A0C3FTU8_PILCF|nr:hypothetical protein PILCRDRAFT_820679 [Piloderma croceum F 1598]
MASKGHQGPNPSLPTNFLPPLTGIRKYSTGEITSALKHLEEFYWPRTPDFSVHSGTTISSVPLQQQLPKKLGLPKGSRVDRLVHDKSVPDSGYASAEEEDEDNDDEVEEEVTTSVSVNDAIDLDALRADPFERTFAIRWLTGFISRSDVWITSLSTQADSDERCETIDQISSLLSAFAGDDQVEEALTRHFTFPLANPGDLFINGEGKREVNVELNDGPISSDDHTSVGLQSWASSIMLAERMCANPTEFGVGRGDGKRRILELGAGTGLLSIVVGKLLNGDTSSEVIATDYHPEVLSNLLSNIHTNFTSSNTLRPPVSVHPLDWQYPVYSAPFDLPFSIILAADVIYHPDHARWIKGCVEKLLLRPDTLSSGSGGGEGGIFWLMMPIRSTGRHEGMCATAEEIFPDIDTLSAEKGSGGGAEWKLAKLGREEVRKQEGLGRADEGGYKIFKIGWVWC